MSITLRFVSDGTGDLISRCIRGGQLGCWPSHVECRMPDGTLLGAHEPGGVQARAPGYDIGLWAEQLYVDVPCTVGQAEMFHAFLTAQVGKPYDLIAIGEMAEGALTGEALSWPLSGSWICSALQTAALLSAGIIKGAPATVRLATPRDVLVACAALVAIGDPESPPAK